MINSDYSSTNNFIKKDCITNRLVSILITKDETKALRIKTRKKRSVFKSSHLGRTNTFKF